MRFRRDKLLPQHLHFPAVPTRFPRPQVRFLNPMISRKPRLQRQRKLFVHKGGPSTEPASAAPLGVPPSSLATCPSLPAGKNFLRPTQMNINVATWGRLMKRAMPPGCSDQVATVSPPEALLTPGERVTCAWLPGVEPAKAKVPPRRSLVYRFNLF